MQKLLTYFQKKIKTPFFLKNICENVTSRLLVQIKVGFDIILKQSF